MKIPLANAHKHTHTHTHTHTCSHTLYNPLIHPCLFTPASPPPLAAGDIACEARDARKFPALILLTFTVTRHFSAWRSSTHSVTRGPAWPSEEMSLWPLLQLIAQTSGSAGRCGPRGAKTPPRELWVIFGLRDRCSGQLLVSVINAPRMTLPLRRCEGYRGEAAL